MPALGCLIVKNVSRYSEGNSCIQFMPVALFPLCLQVFKHISKTPPESSLYAEQLCLSLSSPSLPAETLQSLQPSSLNPSLSSLQYVRVSLVLGSPEMDTLLQLCPHHSWVEGKDLPHPIGNTSNTAKDTINPLGCKGCEASTLLAQIHKHIEFLFKVG